MKRAARVITGTMILLLPGGAWAQDQSLRPGINESFAEPVVTEWVERFEREGREVYDKRQELIAACQISPGMRIADVGAGTGLFTRLFSQAAGPEGHVFAVDISDEFIDNILRRADDLGKRNIQGIVCDVDDAKLPPDSVDLIFICDTYHHFEFPYKTLASLFKALKPGGRLVVVDFQRIPGTSSDWIMSHVRAGKDQVRKEIEDAGFKLLEEHPDILKENYVLVFSR